MKLLIREVDLEIRLRDLASLLNPKWQVKATNHLESDLWLKEIQKVDAVISMDWVYPGVTCDRLKLIQLPGAGLDGIDFTAVPSQTSVCNVFEHEIPIAEYVMAAILQSVIKLPQMDKNLRKNNWTGSHLFGPTHGELHGKTIGILGYGNIGKEVAKRAKPFGLKIIGCGPRKPLSGVKPNVFYPLDRLNEMLKTSDFLLISAPLTSETENLITRSQLKKMKASSIIINIARGPIVDEESLYLACKERIIGGAVIDTWYQYPKTDKVDTPPSRFDFGQLDNVIMSPHASAWTDALVRRRTKFMAENLNLLIQNKQLRNIVK
jgi:phosphoglycerate dehydrogenase-like enzyme